MKIYKRSDRCGFLSEKEIRFRFSLVILMVAAAFYLIPILSPIFSLLLLPSAYLYMTILWGRCPLFKMMNLNENQYFLKVLPSENPTPVTVFSQEGILIYKNEPAQKKLLGVSDLSSFDSEVYGGDVAAFIRENGRRILSYERDGMIWMVSLIGKSDVGLVLAFFQDMTELYEVQQEILRTQKDIIYAMGEIGESRSRETGNHVRRVAEYSYLLAKLYGLDEDAAGILKTASPMHDIGKVGIPDSILKKPGPLSPEEYDIMKNHAKLGYDMLKNSDRPILRAAATVSYEHHEKWDGSGYPNGKMADDIHIYGRITAIADVFDALGSDRVYKKAWDLPKILDFFREQKGRHFDPVLIDLFFDNLKDFTDIKERFPG